MTQSGNAAIRHSITSSAHSRIDSGCDCAVPA
jgi:hypothetical protein